MMKRKLSDEQLDNLMRTLLNDAAVDEATVNDVADSPTLWWGVQRRINEQKAVARSPWPPVANFGRWLLIGVPAFAAVALVISFFIVPSKVAVVEQANNLETPIQQEAIQPPANVFEDRTSANEPMATVSSKISAKPQTRRDVTLNAIPPKVRVKAQSVSTAATANTKADEIKSEFIALSYARSPESGQILRVKVPSSMMVTLGLVSMVEKPTALVDAEVLVGDDGTTHSIRFIR